MQERPRPRRMAIWELCVLIAGIAVGFWLFGMGLRIQIFGDQTEPTVNAYGVWIGLLGGLSVVGPPILLWVCRGRHRRFGPGEILISPLRDCELFEPGFRYCVPNRR